MYEIIVNGMSIGVHELDYNDILALLSDSDIEIIAQ